MYQRVKVKKKRRHSQRYRIVIAGISILMGYGVVMACGLSTRSVYNSPQQASLVDSVVRVADAFELYNHKRFSD